VAFPSYTSYTRKAARRAAQAEMMNLANRQQQFLLTNRAYATSTAALGWTIPSEINGKYTPTIETNTTISPTSAVPAFTVTFTAAGNQSADGNLTITHDGVKSPADKW
jgi:type IV pilus assembly protein PilE